MRCFFVFLNFIVLVIPSVEKFKIDIFLLEKKLPLQDVPCPMKSLNSPLLSVLIGVVALTSTYAAEDQPTFQCISAKITIGDKQVDSVVEWNTKTGEARLLNAASFADKSTGQNGNLIGWVPLVDLQQAVQNLASQIQAQQQKAAAQPSASPSSTSKPNQN
jgi:hypothetical protein